jgi:hypothetical protein
MLTRSRYFDNTLISQDRSEIGSQIEIASSGILEVIEGGGARSDAREEDDGHREEGEGELYDTDNEPYRDRLSDGASIRVNS